MKTRAINLILAVILVLGTSYSALAAVAVPNPLSPASGASMQSPLTISWSAVTDPSGILGYNWQVSTSSTFPTIALQNSTNVGTTQDTVSGLPNGTYFWRVQAVSGAFVKGAWSAARSFNITGAGAGQTGAPALSPTKAYSTFHPLEVMTFNWSPVTGATSYVLQTSKDSSFPVTTTASFNNIPNTTYSFSTPDEGSYSARVYAVNANGIAGVPSNVINYSLFYINPTGAPPEPLSPANVASLTLTIQVAWTDVANPQPSGYELQIAKDSGFQQIEDDSPQLNNPNRTVLSLTSGQKFWRVRSAQGDSSPTTAAVTAWSAQGSFTISAAPAAPASMVLTNNTPYSGDTTWVQVQLSGAAPAAGAIINLTSSNPSAAPVPASVNMPPNTAWMQFQVQAGQVTSTTPVTLTATLNSGQATVQFNVNPPSLKAITLTPASISGGAQGGAIAMLNGQAPAGGAVVDFSSDSPSAMPPALATISFSGGVVTRSATLTLNPVVAPTNMSLAVTAGGRSGERVVSNPTGLSVATGSTGSAQLAPGTAVTLSIASGRDAIWGGACSSGGAKTRTCTLTLNANSSVTANVQ